MIVIYNEAIRYRAFPAELDMQFFIKIAKNAGISVYEYKDPESNEKTIEECLQELPTFAEPQLAMWLNYIPSYALYEQVYNFLLTKNIKLVNTPKQSELVTILSAYYPLIKDLTPRTMFITQTDINNETKMLDDIEARFSYPMFLKGDVKSRKAKSITHGNVCFPENREELLKLIKYQMELPQHSRGKVAIREFLDIKRKFKKTFEYIGMEYFTCNYEFRCFIFNDEILYIRPYWNESAGTDRLIDEDITENVKRYAYDLLLAIREKIHTPFMTLDFAINKDNKPIIIEFNDAQFSGFCTNGPANKAMFEFCSLLKNIN